MLATGFVVEYDVSQAVKQMGRRVVDAICRFNSRGDDDDQVQGVLSLNPFKCSWSLVIFFAFFNPFSYCLTLPNADTKKASNSLAAKSTSSRRAYLGPGFFYLLAAFMWFGLASHASYFYPSEEGRVLTWITLVIWAIYGIVAIVLTPHGDLTKKIEDNEEQATRYIKATTTLMWKNVCYNILDLFSKNATGILVSIVATNYNAPSC